MRDVFYGALFFLMIYGAWFPEHFAKEINDFTTHLEICQ